VWNKDFIKDFIFPGCALLLAGIALALSVAQIFGGLVGPQTRFQEIDRQIQRIEERWHRAEAILSSLQAVQPELQQELSEARISLDNAESAWLDRDFRKAERLLSDSDAGIREILAAGAAAGAAMPVGAIIALILIILAIFGAAGAFRVARGGR